MLKRQYYITFGLVLLVVLVVLTLPEQTAGKLKLAVGGLFLPLFGMAGAAQHLVEQAGNTLAPRSTLLKQIEELRNENQQLREQLMHIRSNMAVLTADGLVGRIEKVGPDRSSVVLIGDPNCRLSAQVQDPRDKSVVAKGIISPNLSSLDRLLVDLIHVPGGALLRPGQPVLTSGDGGVFPKGITVGQIVDVRTNDYGLNLEARVKLAVNLNRLEQVWVMTP